MERARQSTRKYYENNREKILEKRRKRYNEDEEFRRKILNINSKYFKKKWHTDVEFRKKHNEYRRKWRNRNKDEINRKSRERYHKIHEKRKV